MKIRNLAATAGTIMVAALVLSGCSASGGDSNSTSDGELSGTLTGIFDSQYKAALEPIVANFEKKYPDVDVQIDYQGGDLGPVILTQLQGGTAPDVLLSFPGGTEGTAADNVIPLAAGGLIAPIEPDWAGDIPETWKSSFFHDDQLYAFPGAIQPLTAIYNKTMLDEFGLKAPTTLDEVYAFCADASDHGVYAYAQGLGDTSAGPQMLSFAQTASLVYGPTPDWDAQLASGDVTYPKSGWETQFEIYQKMFDAGCFGDGALGRSRQQGQDAVAARQALGLVDVGAVTAGIQKADTKDEFIITAMPATEDGKSYITSLPIYSLTVNAKAKNLAAAKAFVEFAGEPEQSALYATGFNMVPLIPNDQFTPPAELADFAQLVNDGKTAMLANVTPEVQVALNTGVQSMLLGQDTPASLAQKLQDAYGK
ncbi:ABC transporter substrate-binding protein [Microbacterium sp. B2969]|uniref:ABC transporter substrate-binding protein n=1 Tax=Microbacterium alkaliflavum TaxID=3248839 RepID=A0ABW7Q2F7_9MICO